MSKTAANPQEFLPLTPISFHILLALRDRSQHGYGILKEIKQMSEGKIALSAGTLYNAINRLLKTRLIMVVSRSPNDMLSSENKNGEAKDSSVISPNVDNNQVDQPETDQPQLTRYYHITGLGQRTLEAEFQRMDDMVRATQQKPAIEGLSTIWGDAN